jgi:hypothetical protein
VTAAAPQNRLKIQAFSRVLRCLALPLLSSGSYGKIRERPPRGHFFLGVAGKLGGFFETSWPSAGSPF